MGSALVPRLLAAGHRVTVLDLYIFGEKVLSTVRGHPDLIEVRGDIRNPDDVQKALHGCDAVLHLACISNDPSFELNPALGKSINFDAFGPLVRACKRGGVSRFIYASSSSVYGIKDEPDVHEGLTLCPLTDYSKYKAMCEDVLSEERVPGFVTCVLRPATVCGYAARQRLDVIVNILTNHAVNKGRIQIFGGSQKRPNIHIEDMVDAYLYVLQMPDDAINDEVFNVGFQNHTLMELANSVRRIVGSDLAVDVVPTDDLRSYHVSSQKIFERLGFRATRTIEDAVQDLVAAFRSGKFPDALNNSFYYNIRRMTELALK